MDKSSSVDASFSISPTWGLHSNSLFPAAMASRDKCELGFQATDCTSAPAAMIFKHLPVDTSQTEI
jgi:hypothetical protein